MRRLQESKVSSTSHLSLSTHTKSRSYLSEDDANPDYGGLLDYIPTTYCTFALTIPTVLTLTTFALSDAPSSSKEPADERYCWTPDFENIIHIFDAIVELIESGDPAAPGAWELIKQDQLLIVQWIDKVGNCDHRETRLMLIANALAQDSV